MREGIERPAVLLVGNPHHAEFAEPLDWLREHTQLYCETDCDSAMQRLDHGVKEPRVIVLAQPRPGCFAQRDIERLHRRAPLARLIGLLGGYCEGETRTGSPWPGVVRVYWHQFVGRARAEWERFRDGQPSTWSLPRTSTVADHALLAASRPLPPVAGLIAISTASFADFESLSDVCRLAGASVVWLPPGRPTHCGQADMLIWDETGAALFDLGELRSRIDWLRPAHVLALVGFPRRGDVAALRSAGAGHVISKPFLLDDLLDLLAELMPVGSVGSVGSDGSNRSPGAPSA